MNIICEQGSEKWFEVRCGVPTASNFDKIIKADGKQSKQRQQYMQKLAGEIVTGKSEETYKNKTMERGTELESEARSLFDLIENVDVKQIGFCLNENGVGCSPDGLISDDGGLEIKCPLMATHVGYLLDGKLPSEYFHQVQGNLFVTGRKWWKFMSYYPSMKPLILTIAPDEKFHKVLKIELELFCSELKDLVNKIK